MGKEEVKAVQEILGNKKKFKRAMVIIVAVLVTLAVIAIAGFYLGAISYNG